MQRPNLTVRTTQDLACLLNDHERFGAIRLDIAGLTEEQQQRWQHQTHARQMVCGCPLANVCGPAGIFAAGLFLEWVQVDPDPWLPGVAAFAMAVAFAAAGTLAGRWRARRRLRRAIIAVTTLDARAEAGV